MAEWRERYRSEEDLTFRQMGVEYGFNLDTIRKAVHGVTYARLEDPPPVPRKRRNGTRLPIDPDHLWRNPERSVSEWADEVGMEPESLASLLRREGWYVRFERHWDRAPCARCQVSTDAFDLDLDSRICSKCLKESS